MAYNIGINIVEVDGLGSPAIQGAPTSVAAFNVLTRRGAPNQPARITNFRQFTDRFGSYLANAHGAYMVKGFFDNGGRVAYVNRVLPDGETAAAVVLKDGTAAEADADTLTLEAGYRGHEDPGTWGNDLFVGVTHNASASSTLREVDPAVLTSGALGATTDLTGELTIELTVDGASVPTVLELSPTDFPDGVDSATREQIRDAINGATDEVTASVTGSDEIEIASTGQVATRTGAAFTSLTVAADYTPFGFSTGGSDTGDAAVLTGTATQLARVDGFDVGDAIQVSDGTTTEVGKVLRITPATHTIEWTPTLADPGVYSAANVEVSNLEFDLTIAVGGTENEDIVETWTALSMESDVENYVVDVINDAIQGSKYIVATDEGSGNGPGGNRPAAQSLTRVSPGTAGVAVPSNFTGDSSTRTGLYAFDPYDVQLVCCESDAPSVVTAALGYCATRGDCMFVGTVPEGYIGPDATAAVNYGTQFQGKKVYGALYGPYVQVIDPIGNGPNPSRFIPPTGHILGVYARIETSRGIHKAPAGDEANLRGVLDVAYRLSDVEHDNLVRNASVNGIRAVPGAGIVVDASRTLSTDTRWLYVNVRLLFNYVKSSLESGLSWVRQEPNRDRLWNQVKYGSVTPFLLGLYRQGAFGTGTPDEVFTVVCDASNNPPEEVDQGNFRVEIYFYPSKPAETIIIIVGQQPSGGSVSES